MAHGRCTDCDLPLTPHDTEAMRHVNAEYVHYGVEPPYDLDDEDAICDLHCAGCLADRAERAQERRDEQYYGGDTPTLAETAAPAWRFK